MNCMNELFRYSSWSGQWMYRHTSIKVMHTLIHFLFASLIVVKPLLGIMFLCSLTFSFRSLSVAMFYRNDSSVAEPYNLTLPGCAHTCPLQDFIRLTQSVIPTDWHKECQISSPANDKGIYEDIFLVPLPYFAIHLQIRSITVLAFLFCTLV